jgi:serine/threonine-protein kinase
VCGVSLAISADAETEVEPTAAARLTHVSVPDEGRFPPGAILAQRYRIAGLLGKGGMGEVYKAGDLLLGQTVALKFLPAALATNQAMLERFRNEVRIARQVSHPSVCRVYDLGEAEGQPFLSMEFVDGEDLDALLRRVGHPPEAKALQLARRICAGLAAAHETGVLHRDFKPANIMVDASGQARIMDFGLAAAANQLANVDVRSGTPAYMAPEQLSGAEVTALSDIYALGLVLHELFTGRKAFRAESVMELLRLQQAGVQPPAGVDPAIGRIIARCLDPDPKRRPQSALSVAAALPGSDPLQAALEAGETPSPELVAASGARSAMKTGAAVACFAALCAGLAVSAWFGSRGDVFRKLPAELPPDALALRSRDHLRALGYESPGAWTAYSFAYSGSSSAVFWFRAAPRPLTPWLQRTMPRRNDPPPGPGHLIVHTDTTGRLVLLRAFPPEHEPPAIAPVDPRRLFDAAGLDPAGFDAATPGFAPWSPADQRLAWVERGGGGRLVEAAFWRGRPVHVRVGAVAGAPAEQPAPGVSDAFLDLFLLVTVLGSSVLAWRNLRLKRGDLQGALRIGLFMLGVLLLAGLLPAGAVEPSEIYNTFAKYAGWCLYWSAITVIPYLAVEPYVRRKWPRVLIGWTRLLQGGWRDPLVGRELLAGSAAGATMAAIVSVFVYFHGPATADAAATNCELIAGPGKFATLLLAQFLFGVPCNLLAFFLLFAASAVVRNRVAGAALYMAMLAAIWAAPSAHPGLAWPAYLAVALISALVFLRAGILAGGAMFLVFQTALHAPLTWNASAWYFGESVVAVALLAGLAAFALRNALRET